MTALYLDASVIVSLFATEPASTAVQSTLADRTDEFLTSDFGIGEVGAALSRKVRERTLQEREALLLLDQVNAWVGDTVTLIELETAHVRRASMLVRQFALKLRMPDALHVAIGESRSACLVTRDQLMADAARTIGLDVLSLP